MGCKNIEGKYKVHTENMQSKSTEGKTEREAIRN
jgi:hypothetical protein